MPYIAHSPDRPEQEPQTMQDHLRQVAKLSAACFDDPFLRDLARLQALFHDAGKYKPDVQRHLRGETAQKFDHATLGARLLSDRLPKPFRYLVAAPMMGHHGGMPDCHSGLGDAAGRSVDLRLTDEPPADAVRAFEGEMPECASAALPSGRPPICSAKTATMELFLLSRLLHSALVDADALDTERYYKGELPRTPPCDLTELSRRYDKFMAGFAADTRINQLRADIRQSCLQAAGLPQGFFSLTVPTGGGKTLSSLGFALRHAKEHPNIRRIIYAIPFTSIIEQNAKVFRDALGEDAVLEHHSAMTPREENTYAQLATENWNAPLIVTTNVQLFESIFVSKPSKSRKLHHLQDAIIILDEAQALPDAVLCPCLNALDALVKDAHATVVLCSATQPVYDHLWAEPPTIREMMPDPIGLQNALRRTRIELLGQVDDEALTERLMTHPQVLCIVNQRSHAQELYRALGGEAAGAFHLSTLMCPQHRSEKLALIRDRLENGLPCRVVATSLIEAGVDVDFPVVYRAAAGLDSIVQAAGRCNRNGKQPLPAPVYVFEPVGHGAPPDVKRHGAMTLKEIAPLHTDLLSQDALAAYFRLRFGAGASLDKCDVMGRISSLGSADAAFASIAQDFEMIQSAGEPVFVPYDGEARLLLAELEQRGPSRKLMRRLQRYGVTLFPQQVASLRQRGFVSESGGALWLSAAEEQLETLYTKELGLCVQAEMTTLMM